MPFWPVGCAAKRYALDDCRSFRASSVPVTMPLSSTLILLLSRSSSAVSASTRPSAAPLARTSAAMRRPLARSSCFVISAWAASGILASFSALALARMSEISVSESPYCSEKLLATLRSVRCWRVSSAVRSAAAISSAFGAAAGAGVGALFGAGVGTGAGMGSAILFILRFQPVGLYSVYRPSAQIKRRHVSVSSPICEIGCEKTTDPKMGGLVVQRISPLL